MSDLKLVIGNKNYSSWSLRAWLYLRQCGISFREHRIPLDSEVWEREIGKYSPSRRVPVLHHGECVIWDSLAICEYVNEGFGKGTGWPEDVTDRARARAISAEMHAGFPHLRGELPMNCRARIPGLHFSQAAENDIRRIRAIWRSCRERSGLNGPWLFGRFGIADAMYAPVVMRFKTYEVSLAGMEQDYMSTMLSLSGIKEWLAAAEAEEEYIEAEERG